MEEGWASIQRGFTPAGTGKYDWISAYSLSLEGEGWGVGEINRYSLSLDGRGSR